MSTRSVFSVPSARPAGVPAGGQGRSSSADKLTVELRRTAAIDRPVDVANVLKRHGLSLRAAHAVLNALVADQTIVVTLSGARAAVGSDLGRLGVEARSIDRPAVA